MAARTNSAEFSHKKTSYLVKDDHKDDQKNRLVNRAAAQAIASSNSWRASCRDPDATDTELATIYQELDSLLDKIEEQLYKNLLSTTNPSERFERLCNLLTRNPVPRARELFFTALKLHDFECLVYFTNPTNYSQRLREKLFSSEFIKLTDEQIQLFEHTIEYFFKNKTNIEITLNLISLFHSPHLTNVLNSIFFFLINERTPSFVFNFLEDHPDFIPRIGQFVSHVLLEKAPNEYPRYVKLIIDHTKGQDRNAILANFLCTAVQQKIQYSDGAGVELLIQLEDFLDPIQVQPLYLKNQAYKFIGKTALESIQNAQDSLPFLQRACLSVKKMIENDPQKTTELLIHQLVSEINKIEHEAVGKLLDEYGLQAFLKEPLDTESPFTL